MFKKGNINISQFLNWGIFKYKINNKIIIIDHLYVLDFGKHFMYIVLFISHKNSVRYDERLAREKERKKERKKEEKKERKKEKCRNKLYPGTRNRWA